MTGITATEACSNLYRLIDETAEMNAMKSCIGDMEVGLHQASPERCKEAGLQRPQIKSPGTVRTDKKFNHRSINQ